MENIINITQEITLENKRVCLSPLYMSHFEDLLYFSIHEPELWDYALVTANGRDNLKAYIESSLKSEEKGISRSFVIFDKHKNKIAGTTRFYDFSKDHRTISIGHTWYGKGFQGTVLNKNCKFLLLSHAFEVLGIERVEFRADFRNKRSINALKSIGCIEEGILRSNCKSLNGRRDSIILSILKNEWNTEVKKELEKSI